MKIKNKKKLLSAVIAMLCAANTCAVSMPIMAGAEETSTVVGDANLDGVLNIRDAARIANYLVLSYKNPDLEIPENADFDGDGKVYARDVAAIAVAIAQELTNEAGGKAIERDTHDYASISLGETIAVPGETVSIPVNVTCNNNFESATFLVEWEDAELYVSSAMPLIGTSSVGSEMGVNCVSAAVYSDHAVADGEVATIEVTIPEDAVAGTEYKFNITKIETFAEFDGEDLADTVSVSSGSVVVSPKLAEIISIYEDESYEFSDDYDVCEIVSVNKAVATITNNVITAVSAGTTLIEYYADEKLLGTSTLIVKDIEEFEVGINQQKFLYASGISPEYVEWEISDSSVVAIENGVLTGLAEGTAEITGTYNGEICYRGVVTVVKDAVVTTPPIETTTTTKTTTTTTTSIVSPTLTEITTSANEDGQIIGDANLDGVLNIRDAARIANYKALSYVNPDLEITENAEYNGDGKIDVRDAANIAKAVANNLAYNRSETKLERKGSSSAKLSINNIAAKAGETISVPVKVECGDNFESGSFVIGWDSSELTLSSFNINIPFNGSEVIGDGYYAFNAYSASAVADGEIATIEFTVPADAKIGDTYEIYFTDVETFAEFEGEDLADTVSVSGGSVTVIPEIGTEHFVNEGEEIDLSEYSMFDITTSDADVATFVKNTLTGVSAGMTNIQFVLGDYMAQSKVIVMSPAETELMVGEQKFIYASDDASELTWISEDLTVATVKNGNVTAVAEGTTNIYAIEKTSGKYVYSGTVTVTERVAVTTAPDTDTPTTTTKIQSVDVDEVVAPKEDYVDEDMPTYSLYLSNIAAKPGEMVDMPVRIKCDNSFESLDAKVTWDDTDLTSSQAYGNSGVAVSSRNGDGYCEVTCYGVNAIDDGIVLYIPFTIPEDAEPETTYDINVSTVNTFAIFGGEDIYDTVSVYGGSITVTNSNSKTIYVNENDTAVLTGDYDKYTEVSISDDSIAYLEDGVIHAVSGGTAYITLSNETESFEITVNVCTSSNFDIDVNSGKEINIPQIDNSDLIWTSSDNAVATVSEEGVVYGYKRGSATITAYDPDTGKVVWTGTANVIDGLKYGDYLYYEKWDRDHDGVNDYVGIVGCEETATSVHIPAEIDGLPVESIDGFYDCTELAEITVDEEVTCIDYSTFENTAWFKNEQAENTLVVLNNILLDASTYEGEDLEIPEDIEIVAGGVFYQNNTIKHVVIPETVKEVRWAFAGCGSIESVTVENPDCELYMLFSSWYVPEGFVLYGYEGSTAQAYAENTQDNPDGYKITFALIEEAVTTTVTTSTSTTTETTISSTVSEDTTTSTEPETTTTVSASETTATSVSGDTTETTLTTTVSEDTTSTEPKTTTTVSETETTATSVSGETTETTVTTTLTEPKTTTTVTTTVTGEESAPLCGDANDDGDITVRDCAYIARFLAENKKDELPAWADYNGDGEISVRDAAGLSRAIATKTLVKEPYVPVNEGWRAAYKDVMNNITAEDFGTEARFIKYTLYDEDNNSVPELMVSGADNSGFSLLNIYSWNETDGAYKIGKTLNYRNLVPGYYSDNGELGYTTFNWYPNYSGLGYTDEQGYFIININGKEHESETVGFTMDYREDTAEDTVCERGKEYFNAFEMNSLEDGISVDEYFDNWTK